MSEFSTTSSVPDLERRSTPSADPAGADELQAARAALKAAIEQRIALDRRIAELACQAFTRIESDLEFGHRSSFDSTTGIIPKILPDWMGGRCADVWFNGVHYGRYRPEDAEEVYHLVKRAHA